MVSLLQRLLVCGIAAGILNLPAAALERPLAIVLASDSGYLDKQEALAGVAVYAGDQIHTESNGSLRLRMGASQIELSSSTSALLARNGANTEAQLNDGTLTFSLMATDPLEIATKIASIRAVTRRAVGRIKITNPTAITIADVKGSLTLIGLAGDENTLTEGQTYTVSVASTPEPDGTAASTPTTSAAYHHGHLPLIVTLVASGVAGVGAYVLYNHFANESPSQPPTNTSPQP